MTRPVVIFSLLVLPMLVTPVDAAEQTAEIDICREFSLIANEVMTARQMDRPMSETLPAAQKRYRDLLEDHEVEVDEEADERISELVIGAYEMTSFDMVELQNSMISEFENDAFAECNRLAISDSGD